MVRVWDAVTGQGVLTLTGHTDRVGHITFSPAPPDGGTGGKRLATSSLDGTARVWDAASGQQLLILSGYASSVRWVEFSPDGKQLATASMDGTADVWDAMTGQRLLHLTDHTGPVLAARFSPDGTRLTTGSADQTVRIHALRIEELVALARSRLTRSLTTDECRQYLHVDTCPAAP
jgi:WD40 repeat protein